MSAPATSEKRWRQPLLAQIHIAKKELGLEDENYRAALKLVTGCTSAKGLSEEKMRLVIAHFRKLGWKSRRASGKKEVRFKRASRPEIRKIYALWWDLTKRGAVKSVDKHQALDAYVRRMTNVDHVKWLTPKQANIIIEGLKAWQQRAIRPPAIRPPPKKTSPTKASPKS